MFVFIIDVKEFHVDVDVADDDDDYMGYPVVNIDNTIIIVVIILSS